MRVGRSGGDLGGWRDAEKKLQPAGMTRSIDLGTGGEDRLGSRRGKTATYVRNRLGVFLVAHDIQGSILQRCAGSC